MTTAEVLDEYLTHDFTLSANPDEYEGKRRWSIIVLKYCNAQTPFAGYVQSEPHALASSTVSNQHCEQSCTSIAA